MIWVILVALAAAILLYIFAPLMGHNKNSVVSGESFQVYNAKISEISQQIAAGEDDGGELLTAKTALQRKALEQGETIELKAGLSSKTILLPIAAAFFASVFVLYSQLGAPELANKEGDNQTNALQELEGLPLDQLVLRLEGALKADPANPNGWIYYARSLMTLGRYDEALAAYDKVIAITNSDEKIVSERASAVRYIDQIQNANRSSPTGPNAEGIEAAADMTAKDRAAMVQNMVDGLSAKLTENPNDEQGWIRLLRSRSVLGQTDLLLAEKNRMSEVFADQPEIIERILTASGIDNQE